MNSGEMIELPVFFAVGKNGAEQPAGAGSSQEVLLVWRFFVGISGRKHHAFDTQLHHFIEKRPDALGIGSVEQGGVGRNPEAALYRLADAIDRDLVSALAADREVMVFFLPVQVDARTSGICSA